LNESPPSRQLDAPFFVGDGLSVNSLESESLLVEGGKKDSWLAGTLRMLTEGLVLEGRGSELSRPGIGGNVAVVNGSVDTSWASGVKVMRGNCGINSRARLA
jgi:hypothetical protein